jgi:CheY-like chemotaxis protein
MNGDIKEFGRTASTLARNPLGIIALFIVLVYGFACLVTAFSSSFTAAERTPLIYFIVVFPVLVLAIFAWLVSCHSGKLFAPGDFKDEANWMDANRVNMQLSAVASLAVAGTKGQQGAEEPDLSQAINAVQNVLSATVPKNDWQNQILWVDDRPDNNIYERRAFEAIGLKFTMSLNTNDALEHLSTRRFAAVISDMGRKEGPREGYVLLDAMRKRGDKTPLFFYATSNSPEHKLETRKHGGQGCTNNANELFSMVVQTLRPS